MRNGHSMQQTNRRLQQIQNNLYAQGFVKKCTNNVPFYMSIQCFLLLQKINIQNLKFPLTY